MRPTAKKALIILGVTLLVAACGPVDTTDPTAPEGGWGKADSSHHAKIMDFSFDGHYITTDFGGSDHMARSHAERQVMYTVGQLNGEDSVGRMDRLQLSNISITPADDGKVKVSYSAVLPVAWNRRNPDISSYTLVLPLDMSWSAQSKFVDDYSHSCVSYGAHDVTSGIMWYYFRPNAWGCDLAEEDVVRVEAQVTTSSLNTDGKYPEYDKVWKDGALRIVAIFGKFEEGATSNSDAGIQAYNTMIQKVRTALQGPELVTIPADLPQSPGATHPDVTIRGQLAEGREVEFVALLVDSVRSAPHSFFQRYEQLTLSADLIIYNGHSGYGANIRTLASRGEWAMGQYSVVLMNGCDTYAYVDNALNEAHAAVNPDDPIGTKYVDVIANAMPAGAYVAPRAMMAVIEGLMSYDAPKTYQEIFEDVSSSQVIVVSGEEDNTYQP
jgi:hypothetical protein